MENKYIYVANSCASEKKYINETTCLFNLWVNNTPYESMTLKAVHVMPALLLQKPSKPSKSKEHLKALTRRVSLSNERRTNELLCEGQIIQDHLKAPENATTSQRYLKNLRF